MIHLMISTAIGAAVFFAIFYFKIHWGLALTASIAAMMGVNYLLGRRINKAITQLMEQVSQDLKGGKMDRAIRTLEGGLKYGRYQFFVTSQFRSQIGVIHYIKKDFNAAFPYLKKSFIRNWVAQGMLAVHYMRKKDKENMVKTFNRALRYNPKESLLWNLYAYCLLRMGNRDEAIEALVKALKKLPGDEKLQNNLINLQNNKKMKMKNYGELWLQFHLEKIPGAIGQKPPPYPMQHGKRVIRR
ncbi:MAG: tetratricopeptide repeat protein [bacterium]